MTWLPDTNAILRYLLEDNAAHFRESSDLFEKVRSGASKALILECVIVECVYVLVKYYKVPRGDAADRLESILGYKGIVNSDRMELIRALRLFADKSLDIVDCVLFAKSRAQDRALFSFDEKLKKLK